jgi:signal peptidase II
LLLLILAVGLSADLASKWWSYCIVPDEPVALERQRLLAEPTYDPLRWHPSREMVPGGWVDFRLVLNPGAVFGIGAHQRWFFIVFTVLALATAVVVFARHTTATMRLAHLAIGLVLAGGLGNLHDRVMLGRVRDFVHLLPDHRLPFHWTWPGTNNPELMPWVFNLADVMLLTGMLLLLVHLRRRDRLRRAKVARDASAPAMNPTAVAVPAHNVHRSESRDEPRARD